MNLAMQKVMKVRGFNTATDKMELVLKGLKDATFTNGKEVTYVTKDNVKIASFDFGASASITGSSAYIQDDLLAAQLGTNIEELTNTTEIRTQEILTVNTLTTVGDKTATGTAGEEIKFAYILNSDGTHSDEVLTQGAVAGAGVFSYASGTNTYTFVGVADGTKVEVAFYPTTSTARKISNVTSNFTKTLRIEADVLFKDVCTDTLQYGQIVAKKGKVAGEFEWATTEGGEPTTHNFAVEFLSDCDDNMYDVLFFNKANMV